VIKPEMIPLDGPEEARKRDNERLLGAKSPAARTERHWISLESPAQAWYEWDMDIITGVPNSWCSDTRRYRGSREKKGRAETEE
jgi:hypothetical protein